MPRSGQPVSTQSPHKAVDANAMVAEAVPSRSGPPLSSWLFPALALTMVGAITLFHLEFELSALGLTFSMALLLVLFGTVFAAVHHAETLAHRIGEPYGTLLLTLSVTVIEVSLISSMMLGDKVVPTLARDTVFAVIMIVCNGLVGACVLIGGLRFREQQFRVTGASVYLSVIVVLATLTLVLPNYTFTDPGPVYSRAQLAFVGLSTVVLYGLFLYTQTVRHRDYFVTAAPESAKHQDEPHHDSVPLSLSLLLVSLFAVVMLAEKFAHLVETTSEMIGAPIAFAGLVVAVLILLPESVAAIAAARRNQLQRSINLALGSALATIGLTIPAVALVSLMLDKTLTLGLETQEMVLLVLTFFISMLTFGNGRTNIMFGLVHLVVFALFVFLVFVP
ncbi:Ca2+:H+ antiporter [Rhodopseudomonas faecalis]|uniref:Ca2+:H+ antiporter n=1 Tax=Rhodopseudomonas faecalis TaxID=99655 RepID=A0A318TFN7_9BRAD|nr:Ca2+:H+ antiporter [Rhodopseudomonas faecalis]